MEPKKIKFEDLKDLKYGDQIIMNDPLGGDAYPYAYMSKDQEGKFYFISSYGSSLMIKEQETIDGFNVSLINKDHPSWDQKLSDHGKQLGTMLDEFECMDDKEIGSMLHTMIDKEV